MPQELVLAQEVMYLLSNMQPYSSILIIAKGKESQSQVECCKVMTIMPTFLVTAVKSVHEELKC